MSNKSKKTLEELIIDITNEKISDTGKLGSDLSVFSLLCAIKHLIPDSELVGIGERVKIARSSFPNKLSQRALALKMGVSNSVISNVEAGKIQNFYMLEKISNALRVRAEWLLFSKGTMLTNREEQRQLLLGDLDVKMIALKKLLVNQDKATIEQIEQAILKIDKYIEEQKKLKQ